MQSGRHKLNLFVFYGLFSLAAISARAQNDIEEGFFNESGVTNTPSGSGVTNTPSGSGVTNTPSGPGATNTPSNSGVVNTPSTPARKSSLSPAPTIKAESSPSPSEPEEDDGKSHPFFDWSKHQGETYVKHPLADKGLIEITKDKVYIYKVKQSKQKHAGSLRIGFMNPTNLVNPDNPSISFANNYQSAAGNPSILLDFEWQILRTPIGKVGITAGSGLFIAQGSGHFTHPNLEPANITPKETFTLAVFPTNAGVIYRVQMWDRQLFVPYGTGGGTLFPFSEFRDDGQGPKFALSYGAFVAAGLAFNMTYFDRFAAAELDREYGISRVYLTGEYRYLINLSNKYDFGGPFPNFGFTAEF